MNRQLKIIVMLMLCYNIAEAQQLSPETINSAGNSTSNGGILLEHSLGGYLVNTYNTSSFMYTQDFLQPDAGSTNTLSYINDVKLDGLYGLDIAGTTFTAGGHMLEFSLGEVASISLTNTNHMLTQGVLQPYPLNTPLPVIGLEFYAKRLNASSVQLDWKTLQEINNKGFQVERKKAHQNDFDPVGFVYSKALNGNSNFPIDYQQMDDNNYSGNTYYRLKQEDLDGKYSFSIVRLVTGEATTKLTMKTWPIPVTTYVNVIVDGIQKPEIMEVIDMNGRTLKSFTVYNQQEQRISLIGLSAGIYFVKLISDETLLQKIVVE